MMKPGVLSALLLAGACGPDADSRAPDPEPGYFTESASAYQVGAVFAQVLETDEDIALFKAIDAERTQQGYLIADAGFLESATLRANPTDLAWHPEAGLLVADDGSPLHYLSRLHEGRQTEFAPIPSALRIDDSAFVLRLRTDLVAVAPDGTIHVFDGSHLALVSYASDGTLLHASFLPEPARSETVAAASRNREALGGASVVLASELATTLQPLADRRLFVKVNMGSAIGYVLDAASAEATPVVFAEGHEGRGWGATALFESDRILFYGAFSGPQLALARIELVER